MKSSSRTEVAAAPDPGPVARTKWVKRIYWLALSAAGALFAICRYRVAPEGYPNALDLLAVGAEILLLIAPLFDEIKVGDLAVKRAVEQAKAEVKDEITSVRMEIQSLRLSAHATSQVFVGQVPTDAVLSAARKQVESIVDKQATPPVDQFLAEVPKYVPQLATVRAELERQVRRLARLRLFGVEGRRPTLPFWQLLRDLEADGAVASPIAQAAQEVYRVCSAGLHGADLSSDQVSFAQDVGAGVLSALRKLDM